MSCLIDMMRYYVMDRYLVSDIIGIVILLLRCCRFLGGLLGVVVVVIGVIGGWFIWGVVGWEFGSYCCCCCWGCLFYWLDYYHKTIY
jgi:hypothetical protein